jgi:hypothetical protein
VSALSIAPLRPRQEHRNQRDMHESMDLRHRSDQELLSDITELCGSHRELTAKLVAHLAEIEERHLHLEAGFSSLFEFCVKQLKLSEGEAFRRILAARLSRRFPIVCALIASGAVHLSALELLREHLTDENHVELLGAVCGKSKREVEALLAARFPRPDAPSRIRKLPDPRSLATAARAAGLVRQAEPTRTEPCPERARIAPLSASRFKVEFTASAELREKLELVRDLMSHTNPSRSLGVVIERAIDLLVAELERKKLGKITRSRTKSSEHEPKPGRVSRAVRREVFGRDGLSCTYVSANGRRCSARAFLELDHAAPRGQGGKGHAGNIRVRCRAHNQLWAEQAYGRERVERCRNLRQQKRQSKRAEPERPEPKLPQPEVVSATPFEMLRRALTGMGFRDAQAHRALDELATLHGQTSDPLTLEQLLREALAVIGC